jgi:hypothetical protein
VSGLVETPDGALIAVAGRDGATAWARIVRATDWEVSEAHTQTSVSSPSVQKW